MAIRKLLTQSDTARGNLSRLQAFLIVRGNLSISGMYSLRRHKDLFSSLPVNHIGASLIFTDFLHWQMQLPA